MMASAYAPCSLSIGFLLLTLSAMAANFLKDVDIVWGDGRAKIADNGELLTLSLDRISGSGFRSTNQYLFCRIDLQIKLVAGNSAGTVTAYYLSSEGEAHDEIDFEFLGNLSGDPYIVHTNVYTQGKGNREMQFYLWFDPTVDFHTYSLLWNPVHILFYVDGTPIREFKKLQESRGVAYPESQAMRLYSSLWDADEWATRGGLVKTDWDQAPFMASFLNLNADGCVRPSSSSSSSCGYKAWMNQELDTEGVKRMNWVQKNYMVYNYCSDVKRFPQGLPPECFATL